MTPEEIRSRQEGYRAFMTEDFGIRSVGSPATASTDNQVANALGYIAFQMGQINRNLARLVDHLERTAT